MRDKILDGALSVIQEKGAKFTMDDLAKKLGMSKKTIYRVFPDKSTMLFDLVDYVFDTIKEEEQRVAADESLPTDVKFRRILSVMPECFNDMDFTKMYVLSERYPKHYKRVRKRLESGWELTWQVLDEGIKEGCFRDVQKPVFKAAYGSALEFFLSSDDLEKAGIKLKM